MMSCDAVHTGGKYWLFVLLWLSVFAACAQPVANGPAPAAAASQITLATGRNQAGTIVLVEGEARIVRAGSTPRPPKVGELVSEGDTLVTLKNGEVHISMQDTGFIALRPNTRLVIVSYKADGDADDHGIFRLVVGGFRSVTGWIGKHNANGYRVQTPTATIGIRGTDHEPRYVPEGSADGEAGTYDRVFVGQTVIETPAGQAMVAPNQAGFAASDPRAQPRLLAGIPVFFKPSPHEADIAAKHEQIQRMIEQRREERRKIVKEKLAELQKAREDAKSAQASGREAAAAQREETQKEIQELQARRAALERDAAAANEALKTWQDHRKTLQDDVAAGRVNRDELPARRKVLQAEGEKVQSALQDVRVRRKALADEADARASSRSQATQQRLKEMDEKRQGVSDKRHAVEDEADSMRNEMKDLQQKENKRFLDELKADRKGNAAK